MPEMLVQGLTLPLRPAVDEVRPSASSRDVLEVAARHGHLLQAAGLESVDALLSHAGGRIIGTGRTRTTRQLRIDTESGSRRLFLKQWRGGWSWRYFGRACRYRRERRNLIRLRECGVPTADWVALAERRAWGFTLAAALVVHEVPDAVTLDEFVRSGQLPPVTDPRRRPAVNELIVALAAPLRAAHRAGYQDRDLHWRNILVRRDEAGQLVVHWIDSPNGRWLRLLPGWLRARDLADLDLPAPRWFTRTERLRFCLVYAGIDRLDSAARRLLRRTWKRNQSRQTSNKCERQGSGGKTRVSPE
jgi:hypothetical protein